MMIRTLTAARTVRRQTAIGLAALATAGMVVWTATAASALPAEGYADLVEKVSPAVVFISSTQHAKQEMTRMERGQGEEQQMPFPPGSPLGEMFKHFFEQMPQQRQHRDMTALGSGFVIDESGDIVTNNHVIDGADSIKVKLSDGREYDAKVVGTDPQTDLALLKVKADKPLPHVSFGDSDHLRPGDVVLAVGNPFGLGGTVTAGIVSARNRNINAGPYDDFIQTDAAINRGNSGGPLFDTKGNVVGVNTAIYSPNGGSVGIGFAIPSDIASDVVAQLKAHGNVERGWLGVRIQTVTPDIASAIGMAKPSGALVADVNPDSPAAKAGVKQGDIITAYQGEAIGEMRGLPRAVAGTRPGETAKLEILRDGEKRTLTVEIGRLKPEMMAAAGGDGNGETVTSPELGAELATLDDDSRSKLGLDESTKGVLVAAVDPSGPGARQGLRPGDVVARVGSTPVASPVGLKSALEAAKGKSVLLLVNRHGQESYLGFRVAGV